MINYAKTWQHIIDQLEWTRRWLMKQLASEYLSADEKAAMQENLVSVQQQIERAQLELERLNQRLR